LYSNVPSAVSVGAAFLGGVGVNAAAYMASIEGRLMAAMTTAYTGQQINCTIFSSPICREVNYGLFGLMNGVTPAPPSAQGLSEGLGWLAGWRISENWNKIKMTWKEFR